MDFRVRSWCKGELNHNVEDTEGNIICHVLNIKNRDVICSAPEMYRIFKEFCDRVEKGEVRSKRTYAKMKAVLDKIDKRDDGAEWNR